MVILHPLDTLGSETESDATEEMPVGYLINNNNLPENILNLPDNDDNNIIHNKIDNKSIIKENIIPQKNTDNVGGTTFFDSDSVEKTTSTSAAATVNEINSDENEPRSEAHTSTQSEAPASSPPSEANISTKKPAANTANNTDNVAASNSPGTSVSDQSNWVLDCLTDDPAPFNIRTYLTVGEYVLLRQALLELTMHTADRWTNHDADELMPCFTKEQVDILISDHGIRQS